MHVTHSIDIDIRGSKTVANKAHFPSIFGGRLNRFFIDCVLPAQG